MVADFLTRAWCERGRWRLAMMDGDEADSAEKGATNERTKVDVCGEQMNEGATR